MIVTHWWALLRQLIRSRTPLPPDQLAIEPYLSAVLSWMQVAWKHGGDGGIAAHFDLLRGHWAPSYPETTGYTIPTLLACAICLNRPDLRDMAISLADYLLRVRTPEGGVGHWKPGSEKQPLVFDTGQAIFGWIAAHRETGDLAYLQAATNAADWLVRVQSADGSWQQGQHGGVLKVIDTRVAWALLVVAEVSPQRSYVEAARANLDWALRQQRADGWFERAAFEPGADPFTHTIVYTAEGLLESGLRLDEARHITAAEKVAQALLKRQRPDGSLASTYGPNWIPRSRSSCLPGNCQAALLWLRLHRLKPNPSYLEAARRAVAFVGSTQDQSTGNENLRGGIAGSFPLYGRYERCKYPNWAAKFFADALLALEQA